MPQKIKAIEIYKSKTNNKNKKPDENPNDFELVGIAPSKLPRLAGSGGTADSISYDNSKTNLQYITGYDFPKFKYTIPDTINLVLTDANSTTDYPATITKQTDGSYVLNASLSNVQSLFGNNMIAFIIKSISNQTNRLLNYNLINVFWKVIAGDEWTADNGDINIEGIEEPLQFSFFNNGIVISKTDLSDFTEEPYNITLTIKNRQLHNLDAYFLGIGNYSNTIYLSYLNLQNNNGSVKLVGTINGTGTSLASNSTSSYSFLNIFLSNYFNLVSSGSYTNTTEITSSTGKAVKYYFMQNASDTNAVDLVIAYQDGSTISNDDVFTLNLTPDKNTAVDPIYSPVENVQQLGEALSESVRIIADGEEHFSGKYYENADGGRKPLYYKFFKGVVKKGTVLLNSGYYDNIFLKNFDYRVSDTRIWLFGTIFEIDKGGGDVPLCGVDINFNKDVIASRQIYSELSNIHIEYTKTSDSWEY